MAGIKARSWLGRRCPECGSHAVRVRDTRQARMWRRRSKECLNCKARGITLEVIAAPGIRPLIARVLEEGGYQVHLDDIVGRRGD